MEPLFYPKTFSLYNKGCYTKAQIQTDIFSGIIVGILALPLAIAFAIASGVSPDKGLVTAIVAGFIVSFLGGSRVQIGGPTGAFVVIVVGIVQVYGLQGLIISTILAGIILIIFGLLKLGTLIKYIPVPLVTGFTSGIALIIFTSQINDFLGLKIASLPSGFSDKWVVYFRNIGNINPWAVVIAVATVIIGVYSKKIIKKIPGAFISIILMTVAAVAFELPVQTIKSVYGDIPNTFSFGDFSSFSLQGITHYFQPAITIALLGAIESLLSAVVSDGMVSSSHRSNTELIAQGVANIFSGLFGGIPATGAIARTATNVKNGARTPIAGIVHAITLALIVIFFGKYASMIPLACLAGILVVVAYNMSEWRSFISILRGSKYDVLVLLVTFFLTIFADLTIAIEVGIILAAMLFMQRMARLGEIYSLENDRDNIEEYATLPSGLSVYEINGPFFFGAANKYKEVLKKVGIKSKVIILRMRHVPFIDATGMHNFREVLKTLTNYRVSVVLSGVSPDVYETLIKSNIELYIPKERICPHYDIAEPMAIEILRSSDGNIQ